MIVVTTDTISHFRIVETKGQVFGVVVRSRGLGGNIMAGFRSLAGGMHGAMPSTAWCKTPRQWAPMP